MSKLSGDMIRHKLPTHTFGQNVIYTEKIGSTNTELKQLARKGAPEGLLYITDEQLVGRGRNEKKWQAPAESSILMSILFRPTNILQPDQGQRLTMLCAVALAEAIENKAGITPDLKWPNDVIWKDRKKLAGILTEIEINDTGQLEWAVVGIGLNVNLDFNKNEAYQRGNGVPPLSQTATSLSMILQKDTDTLRIPIIQRLLFNIEQGYNRLREGKNIHSEWERRLVGIGELITVIGVNGNKQRGIMAGVDENGALLLASDDEPMKKIFAGDVSLQQ